MTNVHNLVPSNARETVRDMFAIGKAKTIREIKESDPFQQLKDEYNEASEGIVLDPINIDDHFISYPPVTNLLNAKLDFVDQRERLKDPKHRLEIIKTAINFNPKHAGFPVLNRVKGTQDDYLQDWQKRCFALLLRGIEEYPSSVVNTTKDELSADFTSQFKLKDNIKAYDKFKSELSDRSPKHWAMQHCFDRLGVTPYPFTKAPLLTGLGDVQRAMFDPILNMKEKNRSFAEKEFNNFVRAVTIIRRVWPTFSQQRIPGTFIRGIVAIIAMFDKNILKGSDEWIVEILQEAKDPRYEVLKDNENKNSIGYDLPLTWTSKKNWQGNRHHQNAVQSFANVWNTIRKDKLNRKDRRIPKIAEYSIVALDNAKFQNMEIEN